MFRIKVHAFVQNVTHLISSSFKRQIPAVTDFGDHQNYTFSTHIATCKSNSSGDHSSGFHAQFLQLSMLVAFSAICDDEEQEQVTTNFLDENESNDE